jgi:hypothetical protein
VGGWVLLLLGLAFIAFYCESERSFPQNNELTQAGQGVMGDEDCFRLSAVAQFVGLNDGYHRNLSFIASRRQRHL